MLRMLARALSISVLALCALVGVGCGFSTDESGSEPSREGVTLYSGRIAAAIGPAVDRYEAESETDVQVRFADTGDLAATLVEEGSASPADVFFAQEPGAMGVLSDEGLLAPLPADLLRRVPARFRGEGGRWVGVTGRVRVIAFGPGVEASELPDSPLGLVEGEWEGRLGWAPISDSLLEYVTALRLSRGDAVAERWVEAMVANGVRSYPNNVAIRDAIAAGEIDVGLINHYYVAQAVAAEGEDYPVEVFYPPDDLGSLLLVTNVAVLESSDRKQEAFDFVRSLLEEESQSFFTSSSKEYPLAKGVDRDPTLEVPLGQIPTPRGDLADVTEVQRTVELMERAGAL
jgi:iron(III) transport system substrate-binding protein